MMHNRAIWEGTVRTLITAGLLITCAGFAEDIWPEYRGAHASGISDKSAVIEFGPKKNLLWATEITTGHSSPSVWGAHVVVTGFDPKANNFEVIDLDRATGKVRWRREIGVELVEKVHAVSSPATATPILDGERIYVYFGSAGLFCFDFTGKQLWSVPLPVANAGFGSGQSPALAGEAVILPRDEGKEPYLLAVDRKTGKTLWKTNLKPAAGFAGHATPLAWKNEVVLHRPNEVCAFDLQDGFQKWFMRVQSQGTGTPTIDGDVMYVGAWSGGEDLRDPIPNWEELSAKFDKDGDGLVSKEEFPDDLAVLRRVDAGDTPGAVMTLKRFFDNFDGNHDGKISKQEWTFALMMSSMSGGLTGTVALKLGGSGDVTKTNVLWNEKRAVPEVPVPLLYQGRVYTVTNGGIVTILDSASGKVIKRGRIGAGGLYYSSPVAIGGRIYISSGEGVVTILKAGDELEVLARNDLTESIFATPAAVDGKLYFRTARHLYAFGN